VTDQTISAAPQTILDYQFLHGNLTHLGINTLAFGVSVGRRITTETSWISGYKLLDRTLLIDRERDVEPSRFPVAAGPA
jgi:hypothetical protein